MALKHKTLMAMTALGLLLAGQQVADAKTVYYTTGYVTHTYEVDLTKPLNAELNTFDGNNDGVYSTLDAADQLFRIYDRDKNQLIDNVEYVTAAPIVLEKQMFVPVKNTYQFMDAAGNVHTSTSYDSFLVETGLSQYVNAGASPKEIFGKTINLLDKNKDGMIGVVEWRKAYLSSRAGVKII